MSNLFLQNIEYLKSQLTDKHIEIAERVANRGSKTFAEVGKEVGLSERQVYSIRQIPQVSQLIDALTFMKLADAKGEIQESLIKQARGGNVKAIEVFMKAVGMLQGDSVTVNVNQGEPQRRIIEHSEIDARIKMLESQLNEDE